MVVALVDVIKARPSIDDRAATLRSHIRRRKFQVLGTIVLKRAQQRILSKNAVADSTSELYPIGVLNQIVIAGLDHALAIRTRGRHVSSQDGVPIISARDSAAEVCLVAH